MQNLNYEEQLTFKEKICVKNLGKYGRVEKIVGMENPYHYRNKVQSAFGVNRKNETICGVYQSKDQKIVQNDFCITEDKNADEIILSIKNLMKKLKILPFNEYTGKGFLRHVLVKKAFATGEIMVVLVSNTPVFKAKNNFVKMLMELHPEITTLLHNVNNAKTPLTLSYNEKILYGKGYIVDILCGLKFKISSRSFYQINPTQTEILYNTAIDMASLKGDETILDAYCGIGTIGLIASKKAKHVISVESNESAVRDAVANAKLNKIQNTRFFTADAGEFMEELSREEIKCDVALMDPPRSGSDEKFLSALCTLAPKKVVYISCNPETQGRDLAYLTKNGYKVEKIKPVDMFPHTRHVETVCLLSKLNVDHHIEVELNMDELDLTSAESKATYAEIKEYVMKNTGLKVSSLYIAQVKDKMGIKERENFNVSKKDDAKVPVCPADKEKAIIEALEHFNMID